MGSAEVFWAWLARQHSGSAPVNATMASLVDELNLLPPEEREVALTQGVGIAVLIASRGTQDHPVYREDRADRTFGEVMEEALVLVVDWLHEGTLRHRMEHPEELLTEGELRRYEIGYLRRAGHRQIPKRLPRVANAESGSGLYAACPFLASPPPPAAWPSEGSSCERW